MVTAGDETCLLGFGEVGTTLASDLAGRSSNLNVYDTLFEDPESVPLRAAKHAPNVIAHPSPANAVRGCGLVISAVTAGQCVAAARSVSADLQPGAWFLDLNSVSPRTREQAASVIEGARGRYVECAVMSTIKPLGIASPMLLGGRHAGDFLASNTLPALRSAHVFDAQLGRASAAKMCRSVVIKGLEALITESLMAARSYGVESVVLESLQNLMPGGDWVEHARYMISRSLIHGSRRAEEMRQVVATLGEAGLESQMSKACAARQETAPRFSAAAGEPELAAMLDRMLGIQSDSPDREDKANAGH